MCVTCVVTIPDNEPPDRPEIEQVTGGVSDGVMQVLASSARDAATARPALRIVAMIVSLSMGINSLKVAWMFALCGQLER